MTLEHSPKKCDPRILILGKGYIGSNLTLALTRQGYDVSWISSSDLNYHDTNVLAPYILNNDVRYIINCSGFTGKPNVDEAELKKSQCWELNVSSPVRINQLCNRLQVRYLHISSGCIYDGYDKIFDENDGPNFGLFNDSSFYSKSKHAFELATSHLDNKIIRIRMPICNDLNNDRNYLKKIMNYPNLINVLNSKTYVPELCGFVDALLQKSDSWIGQDIYNVVNPNPLKTENVIHHLNRMNEGNWNVLSPNWVDISELSIKAPRSNCVIDNSKAAKLYNFSSESIVLNMVCNYNNGVASA